MRATRQFLVVAAMVLVVTGGVVLISALGQNPDEPDPDACGTTIVTVQIDGVGVALDDQAAIGADECDLRRRGPTPTIAFVGYDCRVVLPDEYTGPPLPERIEPTHEAGTCRQGTASLATTTSP